MISADDFSLALSVSHLSVSFLVHQLGGKFEVFPYDHFQSPVFTFFVTGVKTHLSNPVLNQN